MVELNDIKTGTRMFLQPESVIEDDPTFELGTKFEAELSDGKFSVYAPTWQGEYYYFRPRDVIRVTFHLDGVRHAFDARAAEAFTRDDIAYLAMEQTSPIEEIQLREDFRLPIFDDAKIIFHEMRGDELVRRARPVRLKDLSGGGVNFLTKWDPTRLTEVMMELRLESSIEQISAEIRRIEEGIADFGYSYSVGAKFNFDTEREKERVVRHIFRMQKKMIQEHGRRTV